MKLCSVPTPCLATSAAGHRARGSREVRSQPVTGALHATVAWASPAVAVTPVGTPGGVSHARRRPPHGALHVTPCPGGRARRWALHRRTVAPPSPSRLDRRAGAGGRWGSNLAMRAYRVHERRSFGVHEAPLPARQGGPGARGSPAASGPLGAAERAASSAGPAGHQ